MRLLPDPFPLAHLPSKSVPSAQPPDRYALTHPLNLSESQKTAYVVVADVPFGIEFDQDVEGFVWQVNLVPAARYPQLDDVIWREWRASRSEDLPPDAAHLDAADTVRFVRRTLGSELIPNVAYTDVRSVLDFLVSAERGLAEAVGIDLSPDEIEA